eukprot:4370855-Amphidinium_carterae.1
MRSAHLAFSNHQLSLQALPRDDHLTSVFFHPQNALTIRFASGLLQELVRESSKGSTKQASIPSQSLEPAEVQQDLLTLTAPMALWELICAVCVCSHKRRVMIGVSFCIVNQSRYVFDAKLHAFNCAKSPSSSKKNSSSSSSRSRSSSSSSSTSRSGSGSGSGSSSSSSSSSRS